MPTWFKLNEDRFIVSLQAIKNPCGDLWRFIRQSGWSAETQNYDLQDDKISVTLSQYRDNGYGVYGHAYVTLYGKIKTIRGKQYVIFTRYSLDLPTTYQLRTEEYELMVLWAKELLQESHKINKIPTVALQIGTETITTDKPTLRKIKRWLSQDKRVFYLGCHFLECRKRYFQAFKKDDPSIKTEYQCKAEFMQSTCTPEMTAKCTQDKTDCEYQNRETIVTSGCPRHPSVSAHVKHTIGECGEVEITKQNLKVVTQPSP